MSSRYLVVIDGINGTTEVERVILQCAACDDAEFHIVSCEPADEAAEDCSPGRLRLTLLLARLADRLLPVDGEVAYGEVRARLAAVVERVRPDAVLVAAPRRPVDRWLRRDLASSLRRLVAVDVVALPL